MDTFNNIFDLAIIIGGAMILYYAVQMKTVDKIKVGVMIPPDVNVQKMKDRAGFINYSYPRHVAQGIALVLLGVTGIFCDLIGRGDIHVRVEFYSEYVAALCERVVALVEENGGYETIRSVGVSAPSASAVTGCIENAANLPWKGVIPLGAMLRDQLGLAVAVANDAHITALSEKSYGSAHGMKDFVVISISHGGLGSCFFSNGQPHLGFNGFAGELGHTCVELNGRQCGCGNKGCLEAYCSEKGLIKTAEELIAASKEPTLLSEQQELSIKTIADCC